MDVSLRKAPGRGSPSASPLQELLRLSPEALLDVLGAQLSWEGPAQAEPILVVLLFSSQWVWIEP